MSNARFDRDIRNKLKEWSADTSLPNWDAFEEKLTKAEAEDAAIERISKAALAGYQADYDPNSWSELSDKLDQRSHRAHLWRLKVMEAGILVLALFLFVRIYHVYGPVEEVIVPSTEQTKATPNPNLANHNSTPQGELDDQSAQTAEAEWSQHKKKTTTTPMQLAALSGSKQSDAKASASQVHSDRPSGRNLAHLASLHSNNINPLSGQHRSLQAVSFSDFILSDQVFEEALSGFDTRIASLDYSYELEKTRLIPLQLVAPEVEWHFGVGAQIGMISYKSEAPPGSARKRIDNREDFTKLTVTPTLGFDVSKGNWGADFGFALDKIAFDPSDPRNTRVDNEVLNLSLPVHARYYLHRSSAIDIYTKAGVTTNLVLLAKYEENNSNLAASDIQQPQWDEGLLKGSSLKDNSYLSYSGALGLRSKIKKDLDFTFEVSAQRNFKNNTIGGDYQTALKTSSYITVGLNYSL